MGRVATWPEVLGPHGFEENMNFPRNELPGRPNEEAARKPMPDPSDEDPVGLSEAQARGHRGRRAGKKIGTVLVRGDLRKSGRKTASRDGPAPGGGR